VAGRSTAGSSYKQCSSEKPRDIHDVDKGKTLGSVDRMATSKEDELIWAVLLVYLRCCIGIGRLCKVFLR
jgi:hypothetical protein